MTESDARGELVEAICDYAIATQAGAGDCGHVGAVINDLMTAVRESERRDLLASVREMFDDVILEAVEASRSADGPRHGSFRELFFAKLATIADPSSTHTQETSPDD